MYIIFYLYLTVFINTIYGSQKTAKNLFSVFIKLLSPDVEIHSNEIVETIPDKILLISNHSKLIDYISLHTVLTKKYPDHLPVFVSVDKVKKIPYYGSIFAKNYIIINRKNTETSISDMIQKCKKLKYKKAVIVLFPEGDIYRHKNVVKSDNYCKQNNIKKFNNVLCPKVKAYDTILKYFNPDQVHLSKLTYHKDYTTFLGYNDFLNIFVKYPECSITLTPCMKEKPLIDIWRDLDKKIS